MPGVRLLSLMYAGHEPDVEAEVTFLRTEEGGRQGYVLSGYRPQFFYDGEDHVAVQEFPDKEKVYPGDTVAVLLHFLHPELLFNRIRVGDSFKILEGVVVVAHGKITRILYLVENAGIYNR
jgi:translation elongation factor EF-Tu-like GTPase